VGSATVFHMSSSLLNVLELWPVLHSNSKSLIVITRALYSVPVFTVTFGNIVPQVDLHTALEHYYILVGRTYKHSIRIIDIDPNFPCLNKDAIYWINKLNLKEHPEGGYFTETYVSNLLITSRS
jgi:hypothetical protein